MTAKHILAIHTLMFAVFMATSAAFPFIAGAFPEYMTWQLLLALAALGVLVPYSWRLAGGCPLTVWENRLRERERPGSSYSESFLEQYARKWFGIRISRKFGTTLILTMLSVPLVTTSLFVAFV